MRSVNATSAWQWWKSLLNDFQGSYLAHTQGKKHQSNLWVLSALLTEVSLTICHCVWFQCSSCCQRCQGCSCSTSSRAPKGRHQKVCEDWSSWIQSDQTEGPWNWTAELALPGQFCFDFNFYCHFCISTIIRLIILKLWTTSFLVIVSWQPMSREWNLRTRSGSTCCSLPSLMRLLLLR